MKYLARKYKDKEQLLKDHLTNVANLCKKYCEIENYKDMAYVLGLYHDIGKYSLKFQNKLLGKNHNSFDHTAAGTKEVYSQNKLLAYCINGHHIGLQDELEIKDVNDYLAYHDEIKDINISSCSNDMFPFDKWFITKYLFSCLVDADYTDSAIACDDYDEKKYNADFEGALHALDEHLAKFNQESKVQKERTHLQQQVFENKAEADIYCLNMPTSSGKSLCSLKFALQKAIKYNLKRIIYVIPYTSIIQQTYDNFNKIIGKYIDIVQCHSNDIEEYFSDEEYRQINNAKAKWNCPLIITTNVQFFNTIYSNKPRHLRRLHNLYNSFIVFDEIHSIDTNYIEPCLRGIRQVCKLLNSKSLLMSATLPDYSYWIDTVNITPTGNINLFYNKTFSYKEFETIEILCNKIVKLDSCLIICNTKSTARILYRELYQRLEETKPIFHLSTYMTLKDRMTVIDKIKELNGKCIVVATSLIEVGIDLDFQNVFRELNGIDNIMQAAGRCNREGKYNNAEVTVFKINKVTFDNNDKSNIAKNCLLQYDYSECIEQYYTALFGNNRIKIDETRINKIGISFEPNFAKISKSFNLIDTDSITIIIPDNDIIDKLNNIHKMKSYELKVFRKYSVIITDRELNSLKDKVNKYKHNIYILKDINNYDKNFGIIL